MFTLCRPNLQNVEVTVTLRSIDHVIDGCTLAPTAGGEAIRFHALVVYFAVCRTLFGACEKLQYQHFFRSLLFAVLETSSILSSSVHTLFCDSVSSSALQYSTAVTRVRSFFGRSFSCRKVLEIPYTVLSLRTESHKSLILQIPSFSRESWKNCSNGPPCAWQCERNT